jgi:predicted DNA-binding transcriptional regulator AlpA
MSSYLLQVQDEESFFIRIRKIVKEELNGNTISKNKENTSSIPYIKISEVCRILQVSRPTINDWTDKGYFKKYKVNSRTFYNRDEILEFLSKQGK